MAADAFSLDRYLDRVAHADPLPVVGRVVRTVGLLVESDGPRARVGDLCELQGAPGE
jgi:flagellar biosynthesis/type III secretory pathway ATPase